MPSRNGKIKCGLLNRALHWHIGMCQNLCMLADIGNEGFRHGMTEILCRTHMIKMLDGNDEIARIMPVASEGEIFPVLILLPGGEDEATGKAAQQLHQIIFIAISPVLIIIYVPSGIGWIGIDDIIGCNCSQCRAEVRHAELPVFAVEHRNEVAHLIRDFGDVCRAETLGFATERYVEITFAVETHDAVETSST